MTARSVTLVAALTALAWSAAPAAGERLIAFDVGDAPLCTAGAG